MESEESDIRYQIRGVSVGEKIEYADAESGEMYIYVYIYLYIYTYIIYIKKYIGLPRGQRGRVGRSVRPESGESEINQRCLSSGEDRFRIR